MQRHPVDSRPQGVFVSPPDTMHYLPNGSPPNGREYRPAVHFRPKDSIANGNPSVPLALVEVIDISGDLHEQTPTEEESDTR